MTWRVTGDMVMNNRFSSFFVICRCATAICAPQALSDGLSLL